MANNNKKYSKIKPVPAPKIDTGIDTENKLQQKIIDEIQVGNVDISALNSFLTTAQTREQVYALIDAMGQDDSISAILETYSEDATETNDSGNIVWCESSDENVGAYVTWLLKCFQVDKNIFTWTYNLIKYGDVYLRLYRQSDYDNDLLFGNNFKEDKSLNEDVLLNKTVRGDHYVNYVEMVPNPGEMFELTKFGKTVGFIQAPQQAQKTYDVSSSMNYYTNYKMRKGDVTVFGATDFVHACLQDKSNRTPEEISIFRNEEDLKNNGVSSTYNVKRGQSLLYNSFKVWRELSLLENSVLLNRLTKSALVRILSVETGTLPPEQINPLLTRLKSQIEQQSAINVNNSMSEYNNTGPVSNIIYTPMHNGIGAITAQTLGGDVNTDDLIDLGYFQDKLYGSLRVPKQFFGVTDDSAGFNGGSSLAIISSRYGKAVKQIQNTMCQTITDLVNLFLLDRGLKSYVNKFKIKMQAPVTQEEIDKRDNMRNRVGVVSEIMNNVSGVVSDDIIKLKIDKALLSECVSNQEVIQQLQAQIDALEKEVESGEETESEEESSEPEMPLEPSISEFGNIGNEDVEMDIGNEEATNDESEITPSEESEPVEMNTEVGEGEEDILPSPFDLNQDMTSNI